MDLESPATEPSKLSPEDYYFEGALMVFTAAYHLKRGSCCGSGCRSRGFICLNFFALATAPILALLGVYARLALKGGT